MKAWVWAGALVALTCGGAALAEGTPNLPQGADVNAGQQPGMKGLGGNGVDVERANPPTVEPAPAGSAPTSKSMPPASNPQVLPIPPVPNAEIPAGQPARPSLMNRFSVMAGGGIEAYAGGMGGVVKPGVSWDVTAAWRATRGLGLELGYSGAANEVNESLAGGEPVGGPDVVRNGVNAVATLGLPWRVQPYLLAGLGVNWFSVTPGARPAGLMSETSGTLPLGGGVRARFGHVTADARFDYNLGLAESFAAQGQRLLGSASAGRYQGLLQVGASF